jgi:DNA-binding response OmpR family regulator
MDPAKPESRPILPRAAVPLDSAGRLKALVVDGDDASRAFAAEALHSFAPGFDVATARDPQQALAWIETFSPDLLVTDLRFSPGALGSLRRCRVLVMSSLPTDDPMVESARLESDAVLIKPIGLPYLLETVRKVMRLERSH